MKDAEINWIVNSCWKVVESGQDEIVVEVNGAREKAQRDKDGEVHLMRSANGGFNRMVQDCLTSRDRDGYVSPSAKRIRLRWKSAEGPFFGATEARFVYPVDRMDSFGFFLVPEKPKILEAIPVVDAPAHVGCSQISLSKPSEPLTTISTNLAANDSLTVDTLPKTGSRNGADSPTLAPNATLHVDRPANVVDSSKNWEDSSIAPTSQPAKPHPPEIPFQRKRGRPRKYPLLPDKIARTRDAVAPCESSARQNSTSSRDARGGIRHPPQVESNVRSFPAQFKALLTHAKVPHESDDWLVVRFPRLSQSFSSGSEYAVRSHAFLVDQKMHVCCAREMPSPAQVAALSRAARRGVDFALVFDPFWAGGKAPHADAEFLVLRWDSSGRSNLGTWVLRDSRFVPTEDLASPFGVSSDIAPKL